MEDYQLLRQGEEFSPMHTRSFVPAVGIMQPPVS